MSSAGAPTTSPTWEPSQTSTSSSLARTFSNSWNNLKTSTLPTGPTPIPIKSTMTCMSSDKTLRLWLIYRCLMISILPPNLRIILILWRGMMIYRWLPNRRLKILLPLRLPIPKTGMTKPPLISHLSTAITTLEPLELSPTPHPRPWPQTDN